MGLLAFPRGRCQDGRSVYAHVFVASFYHASLKAVFDSFPIQTAIAFSLFLTLN